MKFALILFAALAVASSVSATESDGIVPVEENEGIIHKMSRFFFRFPLTAPIRTTTTKRPVTAAVTTAKVIATTKRPVTTTRRPVTTSRRPATTTTSTAAPEPEPEPEVQPEIQPEEEEIQPEEEESAIPSAHADVINALNDLYDMESLKDILPPMDGLFNGDGNQEDILNKPMGELFDENTMNLIKSILEYIQSKPPGEIDFYDPIEVEQH